MRIAEAYAGRPHTRRCGSKVHSPSCRSVICVCMRLGLSNVHAFLPATRIDTMSSTCTNMFPPKPKWDVDQIPDLSGKVMIVTGGNAGIGQETVKVIIHISI